MVAKNKKRLSVTLPKQVVGMFEQVRQEYSRKQKVGLTKSETLEVMIKEKFKEMKEDV